MPRGTPFSRRLLVGSVLLGLFVLADVALFGWLLFRSLSEREVSRVLLETREEAETLAEQLAGRAREQGEDLYLAVATERQTQTYIDSVLRQRDLVRTLEIRDREGRLVYQMQTRETVPMGQEEGARVASPEGGAAFEQQHDERQLTYEVADLTVPIADLGAIHIGLSGEELERRVGVLRQELLRQAGVVGVVTLALLVTGYLVIWWLVRRSRALEAQAAEAERMAYIGTLAAGLAHEIRNPLNSLSLNMQMLEEELAPQRDGGTRRLLGITRSEIARLERLVSDFLAYARPRPLDLQRVAGIELLAHAGEVLGAQLAARRATVRIEDESEGAAVDVDPQQLNQLLLNLAQNALAATEESPCPPHLTLRARRDGGRLALEVEDNGVGLSRAARDRVFEVFYSTRKGGTGLGLPIARRIARGHGGELEVASEPGQGTCVRLWLPVAALPAEERLAPPMRPAGVVGATGAR
ncbi:MAG TPA: HAMP domain-containing sensor histidine kinase [Thermoanaerobaculia bacterium]|nr:HAMP domain-containing sensor histidine kinase [Thermoanaerobaculia bacterium]